MRRLPSTLTIWSAGLNELKVVPFLFFAGARGLHLSILIDFHFGECLIEKNFKLIPFQLIQRLPRKWLIFCLFTNFSCHLGKHQKKCHPTYLSIFLNEIQTLLNIFSQILNIDVVLFKFFELIDYFLIVLILSNIKKTDK